MEFENCKIITTANAEKAVIGKAYFYADTLADLKESVKDDMPRHLIQIYNEDKPYRFQLEGICSVALLYPAESYYMPFKNLTDLYTTYLAERYIEADFNMNLDFIDKYPVYYRFMTTPNVVRHATAISDYGVDELSWETLLKQAELVTRMYFSDIPDDYKIETIPFGCRVC